jgi:hypothetical protein
MRTNMRRQRLQYLLAYLAVLAAVVSALMWPYATAVRAQSNGKQKVSADLRQKLSSASKVNVVVKSAGAWSRTLDDAVKSNNGTVTKSFANFPLRAVSLPAAAVDALASRSDVGYVALDREVKLLGHVSLTTGADGARALANYSPTYDGAGVGIAVLDSGLDLNHTAFTQESGSATRIAFSQVATLGAGLKTYASASLTAGKKYYYRISAANGYGSSAYTAVACATTPTK